MMIVLIVANVVAYLSQSLSIISIYSAINKCYVDINPNDDDDHFTIIWYASAGPPPPLL